MIKNFYFFTATILQWKHLLKLDKYKDIIINSFKFLVDDKRTRIFAFVIMPNHIHTVWKISEELVKSDHQRDILRYISQTILRDLERYHPEVKRKFYVGAKDRNYRVWERNPLSIPLQTQRIIEQKINYIHSNPLHPKWNLSDEPQKYKYSSANFTMRELMSLGFGKLYGSMLRFCCW